MSKILILSIVSILIGSATANACNCSHCDCNSEMRIYDMNGYQIGTARPPRRMIVTQPSYGSAVPSQAPISTPTTTRKITLN